MSEKGEFLEKPREYWADRCFFMIDNRERAKRFTQYLIDNFEGCENIKGTLVNLMKILEESYNYE